MLNILIF